MKNLLFTTCLVLAGFIGFSQKAMFKKEKGTFTQSENGSKTVFQLSATEAEFKQVTEAAAGMSDRLVLKTKSAGKDLYSCVLTINHQNHAEYVHKMFLQLGIQSIVVDGKPKTLDQLVEFLKSLL